MKQPQSLPLLDHRIPFENPHAETDQDETAVETNVADNESPISNGQDECFDESFASRKNSDPVPALRTILAEQVFIHNYNHLLPLYLTLCYCVSFLYTKTLPHDRKQTLARQTLDMINPMHNKNNK